MTDEGAAHRGGASTLKYSDLVLDVISPYRANTTWTITWLTVSHYMSWQRDNARIQTAKPFPIHDGNPNPNKIRFPLTFVPLHLGHPRQMYSPVALSG